MILQTIPFEPVCENTESLYFRHEGNARLEKGKLLADDAVISFDSYFGFFPASKWEAYSLSGTVHINIEFDGFFRFELRELKSGEIKLSHDIASAERSVVSYDIPENCENVYPILSGKGCVYGINYESHKPAPNKIRLAIDICTFKREEYLERNLNKIEKNIFSRESSAASGNTKVFVIDNGNTLNTFSGEHISVFHNRNYGGVGGFTRGMLEAENEGGYTHILIMDDDAAISCEAIERSFALLSYLRPEYKDYSIGGAWFRLDYPNIQYEGGSEWNIGQIVSLKHNLDMSERENLLLNEEEQHTEYNGWWFTCIPCPVIADSGLPLPVFIHRDDVEYGIRTGEKFLFLPGISIWHEVFEAKMSGANEYYDIRNLAITNSVHYPEYGKNQFKKQLFKWVSGNIARFRYNYVQLNLKGAEDFCKGIEFLKETDPVELHKSLSSMNYKAVPSESLAGQYGLEASDLGRRELPLEKGQHSFFTKLLHMITLNGYLLPSKKQAVVADPCGDVHELFRAKTAVFLDSGAKAVVTTKSFSSMIKCYKAFFMCCKLIDSSYDAAVQSYHANYEDITGRAFWENYLGL